MECPHFFGLRCVQCNHRPDWDEYFIGVASAVAERADCTRRAVGAVLVDEHRRIIATGYNGGPSQGPSCLAGACPRGRMGTDEVPSFEQGNHNYDSGPGACIAIHAEVNALLHSDATARRGGTLYVTCAPCANCWKVISNSGIAVVKYPNAAHDAVLSRYSQWGPPYEADVGT